MSDTPWTIPIILDFNKQEINQISEGDTIKLQNNEVGLESTLEVEEIYSYDKKTYAKSVYTTEDKNHPGVANVYNLKEMLVGGKIKLYKNIDDGWRSPVLI